MKFKNTTSIATMTLMVTMFLTSSAMAGFDITRMTTVVDDLNGSYTVTKSGRLDNGEFSGTTLTEFNGFHPGLSENPSTLSGVIAKTVTRSQGARSTTSEGSFVIEKDQENLAISFKALSVSINEGEVTLAGDVTVNEEVYDVNDLPEMLAAVLRRVFWMTRR